MRSFAALLCIVGITGSVRAFTVPTYASQQPQAGKTCGTFMENLQDCDCGSATICNTDALKCMPKPGLYNIGYVNAGRCYKGADCDSVRAAVLPDTVRKDGTKRTDEWSTKESWLNPSHPEAIARFERLVVEAKKKGYNAIDPDNIVEEAGVENIRVYVEIAGKYGMKIGFKNEENGTGAAFIAKYPQYRSNVWGVIAEECLQFNDCNKYKAFSDAGIPTIFIEYANKAPALASLLKSFVGAAINNAPKALKAATNLGSVCLTPGGMVATTGPTAEQLQKLAQEAASMASRSGPNPGGGAWSQQDFNRLQPTAAPSYLNPNQSLGTGTSNPYAQQYWQASSTPTNSSSATSATPGLLSGSGAAQPSVGASSSASNSSEEGGVLPTSTTTDAQATSAAQARISCVPQVLSRGGNVSVAWRCAPGCTSIGASTSGSFTTNKARVGSKKVQVTQSTGFTVKCACADGASAPASCSVRVQAPQVRTTTTAPAPAQQSVVDTAPSAPQTCFMGFCL